MKLKATYPNKEAIPEGLQDYYKELSDGTFKLQLDGEFKTQADIDRVKSALQAQRDENEELERKLSKVPDDFDAEKWDKVKDIDPDSLPEPGKADPDTEEEIQRRVAEKVREKERELKKDYDDKLETKEQEFEADKQSLNEQFKESWIKQQLAEKYGFTDQKRLRWLMLDIKAGQHPEIKSKIDTIGVSWDNGAPKIVGSDLKDAQGAFDVLENVAQSEALKDYIPSKAGGGGAGKDDKSTPSSAKSALFKMDDQGNKIGNRMERGKFIEENPDEARKLAKAAGWPEEHINW